MKYKTIGRTGVRVSSLCMGTMTFGQEADDAICVQLFKRCLDAGINFFDTANIYAKGRSEEILGRLMRGQRDELVIASKFCGCVGTDVNAAGCSRRHIMLAIDATLKRLQTDRLDFYFVHNVDPLTPIEETLRALDDLKRQGKILYPAASNMAAWQIMKALGLSAKEGLARIECIQPMYNLVKRQAEVELLPMAESEKLGVITYSPLGAGLLTGKYNSKAKPASGRLVANSFYTARYDEEEYRLTAERFSAYCRHRGLSAPATAIAWVASHPAVTAPIIGARNLEQLEMALGALNLNLLPEQRDEISALSRTPPLATDRRDEQVGMFMHK
ncbi:MAG: aldo/keto reductase [Verrucomicrobiae bacterium]|nr:aldo/keto reductase [Verrucomicrobiae bacterium]